jgi:NNP family nitrate/nitrite transporter-like MFS transporter
MLTRQAQAGHPATAARAGHPVTEGTRTSGRAWLALALALVGFAVNFWAWALLSPLGPKFKEVLALSSFQQALVVAVPVLVGSLGRIPVGGLTDRYGGRVMFPAVSLATVVPVLYLGLSGHNSLAGLLVGGFFLGIGGTAFAVGVPTVSAWFPASQRGLALGLFGMGMGGTAISALTTVKLATAHGVQTPFIITAIALAAFALLAIALLRDAPGRKAPETALLTRLAEAARLRVTWVGATVYAIAFGGYVSFSVYLVTYLKNAYGLTAASAANKMAGFVLLAVLARPVGGWLADRLSPAVVLASVFAVAAAAAAVQASTPALMWTGTIAFLAMAAALGAGSGATFSLVGRLAPADKVGSVTGVVGAAGGLGGFIPPLIMGVVYSSYHSYALGLALLAIVAAAMGAFSLTVIRKSPQRATDDAGPRDH